MKKDTIKKKFKAQKIKGRKSTVSGAFASALAPYDQYDEKRIDEAMKFLGQKNLPELTCVYCGKDANTWDHLVNLVKRGEFRGYGHLLGNLVPCCSDCNSKKRDVPFEDYILDKKNPISGNRKKLVDKLKSYQKKYANEIDVETLRSHPKYSEYLILRDEIVEKMEEADLLAEEIRGLRLFKR